MKKEDAMSLISVVITIVVIVIITSITLTTGISVLEDTREKAAINKMTAVYDSILIDETKIKVGDSLLIDLPNVLESDEKIITADELRSMALNDYADEDPFQEIHLIKHTEYTPTGEEVVTYTFKIEKKKVGEFYEYEKTTTTKAEVLLGKPVFNVIAGVNRPQLTDEMTPLKLQDDVLADVDNVFVEQWYEYVSASHQWANMRYNNETYVWIPRFAYKIQTYYINGKFDTIPEKAVDIIFLREISNYPANMEVLPSGYVVHPAFSVNGNEYAGIWVGKENAGSIGSIDSANSGAYRRVINGEHTVYITSHLMSNSEWGAVAYMAQAMGLGKSERVPNNTSGIEDLDKKQFVAAYLEDNGTAFDGPADVYNLDDDIYEANRERKGDAMYETSANPVTETNAAWYNSASTILSIAKPFLIRGGDSLFEYESSSGQRNNTFYRKVLYVDEI